MRLVFSLIYIVVAGICSHYIGESLPRKFFHPDRFPYAAWKWEKNGKIYDKIHVHSWKDKLPDMSRIAGDMVHKSISRTGGWVEAQCVLQETCVAETVHWVLMLLSFIIYWINPTPLGAWIAVLYGLTHVPFIIIQRYNRPYLALLTQKLKQREERIKHANTDSVR